MGENPKVQMMGIAKYLILPLEAVAIIIGLIGRCLERIMICLRNLVSFGNPAPG